MGIMKTIGQHVTVYCPRCAEGVEVEVLMEAMYVSNASQVVDFAPGVFEHTCVDLDFEARRR